MSKNFFQYAKIANENCRCHGLEPTYRLYGTPKNRKELIFYLQASLLARLHLFLVEDIGVEPMTLCVQGRCSSQLS
jgi:hypothetical protein